MLLTWGWFSIFITLALTAYIIEYVNDLYSLSDFFLYMFVYQESKVTYMELVWYSQSFGFDGKLMVTYVLSVA